MSKLRLPVQDADSCVLFIGNHQGLLTCDLLLQEAFSFKNGGFHRLQPFFPSFS